MTTCKRDSIYRYTVRRQCVSRAAESGLGEPALTPEAAAAFFHRAWRTLPQDRESFVVAMLDARNVITGFEVVAIGSLTSVDVHPREVFKAAVLMSAAGIIIAHNHPSGDPTPSDADIVLTQRLMAASTVLGIPLVDHIVIGAGDSFRAVSDHLTAGGVS
jgi:DNA repair protein RadC